MLKKLLLCIAICCGINWVNGMNNCSQYKEHVKTDSELSFGKENISEFYRLSRRDMELSRSISFEGIAINKTFYKKWDTLLSDGDEPLHAVTFKNCTGMQMRLSPLYSSGVYALFGGAAIEHLTIENCGLTANDAICAIALDKYVNRSITFVRNRIEEDRTSFFNGIHKYIGGSNARITVDENAMNVSFLIDNLYDVFDEQ